MLNGILKELEQTKTFRQALELLERPERRTLRFGNLYGSSKSLVAAGIAQASGRQVLLVTRGARQAERLEADLVNFLPEDRVWLYPQWEILPYEDNTPDPGVVGPRQEVLSELAHGRAGVAVVPVRALLQRVRPPEDFCERVLTLRTGELVDLDALLRELTVLGFRREAMVEEVGTFSLRGGILDIYGYRMENPVRLELFGDELTEIRHFEIASQRSTAKLSEAVVLPVSEPFTWKKRPGEGAPPLADLCSYLDPDALVLLDEEPQVLEEAGRFLEETRELYQAAVERRGPVFHEPEALYLTPAELDHRLESFRRIELRELHLSEAAADGSRALRFDSREAPAVSRNLDLLRGHLHRDHDKGRRSIILCDNKGQLDRLDELLGERDSRLAILALGSLETGFHYGELELILYTDHEIFKRFRHLRTRRAYQRAPSLENFTTLQPGDYVVHIDYGIGRYRGMKKIETEGLTVECLWLEYADGDFLYVPVDQLSLVERYTSEEATPPALHKIGGTGWARMKARTVKSIEDMTKELLDLYAARKVNGGHAFATDNEWQRELEQSFVYEETADQDKAIAEIKADMEGERCMDRLLCGDVGFGKTEVALRAAFKAVQDGKQVAVLVPTTILAQQHHLTFSQRLADFPLRVATLSRFRSPQEQKQILAELAAGKVDIIIGTHRLLSKDVKFADLGLLVIDEEHRFGVRQKEKLKALKLQVDTLAMTATPIPRSLHMSMMGIRDLSLITTPPQDRLPIQTEVAVFGEETIIEAVHRELARDGQVFFVHNRIGSIYAIYDHLRRIVPEARMAVAHGQMPERELERVMKAFQNREIDLLLSTMIIESGLDFPNANTIIVNRADRFGLSQLYQLRGRVGRSYHRAYAYLLVPPQLSMTDDAVRRLRVLEEYTELGSGYEIAMRDLELRGTGNLLGSQQHGHINAVGFDTYLKLLEETIERLRGDGRAEEQLPPAKINLDLPAFLPDSFVPDSKQKLALYRKLSKVRREEELEQIAAELADRFGPLPDEALHLLDKSRLRLYASRLRMEALFIADGFGKLDFGRTTRYRLAHLIQALEAVEGQKRVVSVEPPAITIKPRSGQGVLPQLLAALARMAAEPGRFIEEARPA